MSERLGSFPGPVSVSYAAIYAPASRLLWVWPHKLINGRRNGRRDEGKLFQAHVRECVTGPVGRLKIRGAVWASKDTPFPAEDKLMPLTELFKAEDCPWATKEVNS